MRLSSVLSIAVALVFGALAAFLARGLLLGARTGAERPAAALRVVVAAQPVAFGAPLGADNLREVDWPAGSAIEGAFASVADLTKDGRRLALAPLQRNEPVLAARITAPNQRATLSTQLDEGKRAVSVRVDEVRGVAGFVLPGDRVDVILTRGEAAAGDAAYADILLQNAKVLAIDQLANERQDKPAVARAVTLELDVEQAQKVVLAQGIGRLSLILRQPGEPALAAARRVTADDLGPANTAAKDKVAELEARLDQMRKSADEANTRAGLGMRQQLADLEMRLRGELAHKPPPVAAAALPAPAPARSLTITVIRNGSKREPYTIAAGE